jgi:hypothetical protein
MLFKSSKIFPTTRSYSSHIPSRNFSNPQRSFWHKEEFLQRSNRTSLFHPKISSKPVIPCTISQSKIVSRPLFSNTVSNTDASQEDGWFGGIDWLGFALGLGLGSIVTWATVEFITRDH